MFRPAPEFDGPPTPVNPSMPVELAPTWPQSGDLTNDQQVRLAALDCARSHMEIMEVLQPNMGEVIVNMADTFYRFLIGEYPQARDVFEDVE